MSESMASGVLSRSLAPSVCAGRNEGFSCTPRTSCERVSPPLSRVEEKGLGLIDGNFPSNNTVMLQASEPWRLGLTYPRF